MFMGYYEKFLLEDVKLAEDEYYTFIDGQVCYDVLANADIYIQSWWMLLRMKTFLPYRREGNSQLWYVQFKGCYLYL